MGTPVTSGTYIRKLSYSVRRQLSDYLDPQDRWKDVIVLIRKPNGDYRYSQHHVRRFEGLVVQGKSATQELLSDWGTTNCTVGELVDILKSQKLWSAACFLLPETVPAETPLTSPPPPDTHNAPPTRPLGGTETAVISCLPTERMLDSREAGQAGQAAGGFSCVPYWELVQITGNFDDRPVSDGGSRVGEGGFGTVYKGILNNKPVAVKKLIPVQDVSLDELRAQFNQEIQTLTVLNHENLVDMVGFSCDGQHPCLVYPLMANGSLLDRLACLQGSAPLSWQQRCSIAEGSARGLDYLHSNHHVHRDVKSANILLDERLVAKISDFGLTRASAKRTSTTMITERIVGTKAYMAPEALRGKVTPKSDVFSFGVVLLEILSGLPPVDENREPQFLLEVMNHIDDEDEELTFEDFLDKKMDTREPSGAQAVYTLACSCLDERRNKRPLIKQVLVELEGVCRSASPDLYRG